MTENKLNKTQFILSSGAKLGAAQTALLIIIYLGGGLFVSPFLMLNWVIFAVLISVFTQKYRDQVLGGHISYGKCLGFGVRISMYSGIITGFFYFLMLQVFDPGLKDVFIAHSEEAMLATGFSESYVEKMRDSLEMNANPWVLFISSIIDGIFKGFIVGLITSIFIKRKGDPFQEAMQDVQ
ncbi:DUF4199 domain-containing protein [Alkalitalea saponilacus]|uniref:DUF4199 domain-containing protein n=1 Tax=Alkalitalea saponilacus TaxID=889453 RepID=A0A1T5GSY6_9BACT|nr:DUF4199 domain-containing protein [Alkalitalea saponilacus]ASB48202.1 hypothetical protein CDL62_03115 [Alkalitalea saponilacus]SKC11525.1 Protein of unknown function [Alkalitalea saponilacus]